MEEFPPLSSVRLLVNHISKQFLSLNKSVYNWEEPCFPPSLLSMDSKTSWDSLRKQARKLEAQLDDQIHVYRKLVSTKVDHNNENNLGSRIEQLLKELQQVISLMQSWLSTGGPEIFSHTLTRHQEIHHDLTKEFSQLRSSLKAKRDHASLLEDFREFEKSRLVSEDDGGSQDQYFLKERGTLMRNTRQMEGVISQAQETLGTLVFQRSTFGGIGSKIGNVKSRLPTVSKQYYIDNKEEKINGDYYPFHGCLMLYISDLDLLVDKIVKLLVEQWKEKKMYCLSIT
ncbi:hypothetical protein Lser_V15G22329 [Lactuca serriola]